MGVPTDQILQQIASQYGLMGPQQSQTGLMGGLNAALAPYGGATNVALSLLGNTSGATAPMAALAQGMQNAQALKQKNDAASIQNMQGLLNLQQAAASQQMMNDLLKRYQSSQSPQTPPQGAPDQPSQAPFQANSPQSSLQTSQAPPQFAGMQDISQIPINGVPPDLYRALALRQGKFGVPVEKEIRDYQLQIAQQQAKPTLDTLDTIIHSGDPITPIRSNPAVAQAWAIGAPQAGLDPQDLSDPAKVRMGLTLGRNALASHVGLAPANAPVPLVNKGIQQLDPVTGKVEREEELQPVIGDNGQPVLLPRSQAVGKQPFNPTIFGANNMTDQAIQFAADTYRTTGKMPPAFARNPAAQAKVLDRVASDAATAGDTAGSVAARQAALKANGQALDQVTKLETATNGYAATLEKNLTNLEGAYKKAGNLGVPLLTKVQRYWQQNLTGDADTASMVTWLNAVQGEYAKLKSGNLGNAPASDASMRDAKEVINKLMNEGGIAAVSQAMRQEAANRKSAIAEQKQSLMGGLSQNAPKTGVGPKVMPTGPKLQTYAQVHFGGDIAKASAYLKSQGYQ